MKKKFIPPTIQEVEDYVKEHNLSVNPYEWFMYFEAGEWIDSHGTPVRSWKQKLWTHHWYGKQGSGQRPKKPRLLPIVGKSCSVSGCKLPAVYKEVGGAYDHYKCINHMPSEVKEMYG